MSFRELFRRVTQAANLFRDLGVTPETSVSMLLPLLPETVVAMIGAQTAGMANPINFLLEPQQIVALLREARCRVLLAPDPAIVPGLWPKVEAALAGWPDAPALLRVGGPPGPQSFEAELDRQPADALAFTRAIGPADVASLVPHRRHHGFAETRAPHPRRPGAAMLGQRANAGFARRRRVVDRRAVVSRRRRELRRSHRA